MRAVRQIGGVPRNPPQFGFRLGFAPPGYYIAGRKSNATTGGDGIAPPAVASFPLMAPDWFPCRTPLRVTPTSQPRFEGCKRCRACRCNCRRPHLAPRVCALPSVPTGAGSGLGQEASTAKTGRLLLSAFANECHPPIVIRLQQAALHRNRHMSRFHGFLLRVALLLGCLCSRPYYVLNVLCLSTPSLKR